MQRLPDVTCEKSPSERCHSSVPAQRIAELRKERAAKFKQSVQRLSLCAWSSLPPARCLEIPTLGGLRPFVLQCSSTLQRDCLGEPAQVLRASVGYRKSTRQLAA